MEPVVSASWLREHLHDPKLVLLFVMGLKKQEHDLAINNVQIPGSRWFNLKTTFQQPAAQLPNTVPDEADFSKHCQQLGINQDSKIILYDANGVYSSPRAWWLFRLMGHEAVAVLNGGLPAWEAMGGPLEPFQQQQINTGNFSASLQQEKIRYTKDLVDNIQLQAEQVLDARSAGRFTGSEAEPRAGLESGHIPNSKNLPFTAVLKDGQFSPATELQQTFKALNLDDRPVVFSCGSGITACILLMAAAQVLDKPCSVYDGSWTEWASTDGLPINKGNH